MAPIPTRDMPDAEQTSSQALSPLNNFGRQAHQFRCQLASGLQQRFNGAVDAIRGSLPHNGAASRDGFQLRGKGRSLPGRARLPSGRFASVIPGNSVAEQVITTGLSQFLSLYNTAIIIRLVLTWFPNPPQFIAGPLSTLCDPYLNLFRGIIPPLNGTIDLSPILAFVALDLFSSTAAALPAEVGPDGKLVKNNKQPFTSPVSHVMLWRKRLAAQRSNRLQNGGADSASA